MRTLTTVYVVACPVEPELALTPPLVAFTIAEGVDGIVTVFGVAGAPYMHAAGVGGTGRLPSATGLHPDLIASDIVALVRNSDTQAALSYRFGILDPGSH